MSETRSTKYSQKVLDLLAEHGHATNAELLILVRLTYPEVSATTIHRVTQRLSEQGKVAAAPSAIDGSKRYDFNTSPHDHFICSGCHGIRDVDVADKLRAIISDALGGCKLNGRLTITGQCNTCLYKEES